MPAEAEDEPRSPSIGARRSPPGRTAITPKPGANCVRPAINRGDEVEVWLALGEGMPGGWSRLDESRRGLAARR